MRRSLQGVLLNTAAKVLIVFCCGILFIGEAAYGQPLRIAAAANVRAVAEVLRADFFTKTGIKIELVAGSSGKLAAQIENGAPFDIFLSADMHFPLQLYKKGFGRFKPRVYASGSLIFCTVSKNVQVNDWQKLVVAPGIMKIAIANPATAPYGRAAQETMEHYRLLPKVQNKLVYGESISQVNTYIITGTVGAGFTAESLVHETELPGAFKWVRIDQKSYTPITQGVILLKNARTTSYRKAELFYNYLFTAAAKRVFKRYGYKIATG